MSEIFSKILKDKNGKVLNVGSKYQQPEWGSGKGVVLAETTHNTADGELFITTPFAFVDGETYTVYWNGTAYDCDVVSVPDEESGNIILSAIGDVGGLSGELSGTHPFCIVAIVAEGFAPAGIYGQVIPLDGNDSFTVSVEGYKIHPIPAGYIEPSVMYVEADEETATINKPYEELMAAINAGKCVILHGINNGMVDGEEVISHVYSHLAGVNFDGSVIFYNGLYGTQATVDTEGKVSVSL